MNLIFFRLRLYIRRYTMYRIGEKIASEWAEARLPHHIRKLSEFMDEKDDDDDDDRSHRQHNHILGVLY